MRKIKFYLRCIKLVWKEKDYKTCRNKLRRMAREFESLSTEVSE